MTRCPPRLRRPGCQKRLGLPQGGLDSGILKVRWLNVRSENPRHQNAHVRPSAFLVRLIPTAFTND